MSQAQEPNAPGARPANRIGVDYRRAPAVPIDAGIIDMHTHVRFCPSTAAFFEAARLYGVESIATMTPLDEVPAMMDAYADRLQLIAVPRWRELANSQAFQRQWLADLEEFHRRGARCMKFWVAPPLRGTYGLRLQDAFFEPLIRRGLELGYFFMIHVADPTAWFEPGGRYADAAVFGTKHAQYDQLEYLLEQVAPRPVVAAHFGGNVEEPEFLHGLLERYPHLHLDSSATKWVVRGVARRPDAVRELLIRHQDRVLFGSDLVVGPGYDFEHYASRYWAQRTTWETEYRGESNIDDPDAEQPPRLAGLALPPAVLRKLYRENAARLGF